MLRDQRRVVSERKVLEWLDKARELCRASEMQSLEGVGLDHPGRTLLLDPAAEFRWYDEELEDKR